jgi:CubicO group peptidase (beta-lactamase class C family)
MKKNRVVYLTRLVIAVCILATCLSTSVLAVSCTSSSPSYSAAIQEGQTAAQEMLSQNKGSAIAVALVDRERVIWTETFGLADREKGIAPSDTAMFGIGSVSKMFATIAAMRLVDLGLIRLDDPLVQHLPNFKMASPEYQQVTIRMLLDHSSGFPGTDYRNAETTPPLPGYLDQLLQSLSHERLKAPPGYTNVYCNDGFTLIEALVLAKTGKTYAQFVQEEILIPLGMAHTRYPLDYLAEGSFAKAYVQGVAQPQDFVNTLGSGGVYSTAPDMAQLARMFLGNGAAGKVRILSAESVAEMAKDQTADNFQPVRSPVSAFGLGWDTVTEPGLLVAGVTARARSSTRSAMVVA